MKWKVAEKIKGSGEKKSGKEEGRGNEKKEESKKEKRRKILGLHACKIFVKKRVDPMSR